MEEEVIGGPLPSEGFRQAGSVPFKWEIQPGIPKQHIPSSAPSSPPHYSTLRPPPPGPSTIFSSFSGVLTPTSARSRSCRSRSITRPSPSRTPSSSSSRSPTRSLSPPVIRRRSLQSAPIALGCFFLRRLRRRARREGSASTRSISSGRMSLPGRPFDTVSEIGTPVRDYSSLLMLSPFYGTGDSPLLTGRSLSGVIDSPRFARVSPRVFSSFRESPPPPRNDLEWAMYGLF